MYLRSIDALLNGYARKTLRKSAPDVKGRFLNCYSGAKTIENKAKCLVDAFDNKRRQTIVWTGSFKQALNLHDKTDLPKKRRQTNPSRVFVQKTARWKSLKRKRKLDYLRNRRKSKQTVRKISRVRRKQKSKNMKAIAVRRVVPTLPIDSTSDLLKKFQSKLFTDIAELLLKATGGVENEWETTYATAEKYQKQLTRSNRLGEKQKLFLRHRNDVEPAKQVFARTLGVAADDSTVRILSPQLLRIFRDRQSNSSLLSPSLFSLAKRPRFDDILPLIEIMKKVFDGNQKAREAWIEFLMHVTGTTKKLKDAVKLMNDSDEYRKYLKADNRAQKVFINLKKSYTRKQRLEVQNNGFAFLDVHQLGKLYGEHGIYDYTSNDNIVDLKRYSKLSSGQKDRILRNNIRRLSGRPVDKT